MATKTKGIDISYFQPNVNYSLVAEQVDFVILREGYRLVTDSSFFAHVKGFTAVNVPIHGIYHFIYSTTKAGAINEAKNCVENAKKAGLPKSCYIWADLEYDTIEKAKAQGVTFTRKMINEFTLAFCEYVKSQGYKTGIYCNNDYYNNYYYVDTLTQYPLWLADYTGAPDQECLYQQYSESGRIRGIDGNVDLDYYYGPAIQVESPKVSSAIIDVAEEAVRFMEKIAADDSHGYDQGSRWGSPDYDCSSLVITAWETSGVPVKTNGATYTGNMYDVFTRLGFKDVTNSVNLSTGAGLMRGDVLLNHANHTAMYCGNGLEVEASINERGGILNGQPGDQTGREILVKSYRNYPWNAVLRYDKKASSQVVTSTTTSTSTGKMLSRGSVGEDVKILQQKLVSLGHNLDVDGEFGPITEQKVRQFQKTYDLEVDGIAGPKTLTKLDKVVKKNKTVNESKTTEKNKKSDAPSKQRKYVGKVTADVLNVRRGPGFSYLRIKSYPQLKEDNLVDVCDTVKGEDGSPWLYIRIAGKFYGYVSAVYIVRV